MDEFKIYGELGILGLKDYVNYVSVGDTMKDSTGAVIVDPYTGLP